MSARRWFGIILTVVFTPLTAFFGLFYYQGYWRWRGLFNSEGRYFDPPDSVVHHQQNEVLIVPLAICLGFTLLGLALAFGLLRRQGRGARR
jgi:hypothetical protein